MNTSLVNLSPAQLRRAANLKEQIARLEKELGSLLGNNPSPAGSGRRKMTAAARAKISAAAKARWAKAKKAGKTRL